MIDIHSPTWEIVSKVCEDHLAAARMALEARGRSIEDTEHARGAIRVATAILDLAKFKEAKKPAPGIGSIDY